jgi:hypothetical protein
MYRDAAAIDEEEGDLMAAAVTYAKAGDLESQEAAVRCCLDFVSSKLPLGIYDDESDARKIALASLRTAEQLQLQSTFDDEIKHVFRSQVRSY